MKKILLVTALALPMLASAQDTSSLSNYSDINPSFMTNQNGNMNNSQININQGAYSIIGGDQCANTTITGGVTYNQADGDSYQPYRAESQSDNKGVYLGFQMAVGEVDNLCRKRAKAHVEIQRRKMNEDLFAFCGRIYSTLRDPNAPVFDLVVLKQNKDVRHCLEMIDERASFPRLFAGAAGYQKATLDAGAEGVAVQRKRQVNTMTDPRIEVPKLDYAEFRVQLKIVTKLEHVKAIHQHMQTIGWPSHARWRVIEFGDAIGKRYSLNIDGFTSLEQAVEYARYLENDQNVHFVGVKGSKLK